jgi:hypothetical protein
VIDVSDDRDIPDIFTSFLGRHRSLIKKAGSTAPAFQENAE